jgi:hypothetical protein
MMNRTQCARKSAVKLDAGDEVVGMVILDGGHDMKSLQAKGKASPMRRLAMRGEENKN